MNLTHTINEAIDLFERQGTHTIGALARDAQGGKVAPTSPYAVQWDAVGAALHLCRVDRIVGHQAGSVTYLLQRAAEEAGYLSTRQCNDRRGRQGAIWMYRRARHFLDTDGPPTRAQIEGSTP